MVIHSLRQTGPERVTLCFDDGLEYSVSLGIVTELRLYAGKDLDETQFELIKRKNSVSRARELGLELLGRRMYSISELREKLLRKGTDPEATEDALIWLHDHRYLEDSRYATAVVRHYSKKGYGLQRIRSELFRRGIPREFWEDALDELTDTEEQLDRYLRSRLKDPSDRDEIRRLSASLARRGFSWDEIRSAFERFS